jgi:hypothetical protein
MKSLLFISIFGVLVFSFSWAQKTGKTYGVILNGGGNEFSNEYRYYQNVTQLHGAFVESGIPKSDIYTLYASGNGAALDTWKRETKINDVIKYADAQGKLALDPQAEIKKDVKDIPGMMFNASNSFKANGIALNGSASKQDLKKTFTEIAKKAKPGDLINFYITDHGTPEGEVVMWGGRDKLAAEKSKKDLAYEAQNGVSARTVKTMSVDEIKEILKVVPKGVTVQIANNICYGGKLLELTDPDRGICVASLEGPNKFVTSGVEKSGYVERYSENLKSKNFYESYLDAKNNDFQDNIGSWNSLDYFINGELKNIKASSSAAKVDPLTCSAPNSIRSDSEGILQQSQIQAAEVRLNQVSNDLSKAIELNKQYLGEGSEYEKKLNAIKEKHKDNHRMKAGKDKDNAYKARDLEEKALDYEKDAYAQRVINLEVTLKSLEKELQFLKVSTPEQRAKYSKIKSCLERNL